MKEEKTPFTRSEDPWLVCSHGKNFKTQTFYNVSEDRYYNKTISVMDSNLICTCSHGWLIMLGRMTGDLSCFLWNPVTMMTIQLPQFDEEFDYDVVVLTSPPNIKPDDDNNCVVAFFEEEGPKVKFCRPGDKEWIVQELPLQKINDGGYPVGISSAVTCGGKIYGILGLDTQLVIIDVGKDHNTMLTVRHQGKQKISSSLSFLGESFDTDLVESCGEVFLTRRIYRKARMKAWEYGKFKIPRVEVFKLDFEELEWREVKTLGDHRAFILGQGNTAFSCPCSPSSSTETATTIPESADKIKSNCIYLIAPDKKNLYIYDIKDRSTTAYFLFRDVHHNRSTPIWILPVFS